MGFLMTTFAGVRYFLIGLRKQGDVVGSWVINIPLNDEQEALKVFEKEAATLLVEKPNWSGFRLEKVDRGCVPPLQETIREEWAPQFKPA